MENTERRKLKEISRFSPTLQSGLSSLQVESRIEDKLTNEKEVTRSKSYARIICENVFTFVNVATIIIIVALICAGQINDTFSSCLIFINMVIGIYQEVKAKRTVEKLSLVLESTCQVLREGVLTEISTKDLVLDDIFLLKAGMQIPLDCILLDGYVEVNESILTGETAPVKKSVGEMLLAGSHVLVGEVWVKAERVGKDCYIRKIAKLAKNVNKPKSNIFKALDKIIKVIAVIMVAFAIPSIIINLNASGGAWQAAVKYTSASMLGMMPVGMFFLTSFSLAAGVLKLSKKNALAQDLYSIEMLAMTDTLLLDKTGTITTGELQVVEEKIIDDSFDYKKILSALLYATKDSNVTANALINHFGIEECYVATDVLPFSSKRKFSAVSLGDMGTFCLGAPDFVLSSDLLSTLNLQEGIDKGYRILVLSHSRESIEKVSVDNSYPIAVISLEDTLRNDAKEILDWFAENEVDVKIISGDHPGTVSEIAKKAGVKGAENYLNCTDLTFEELEKCCEDTAVFGRVSPEQKADIVHILQEKGHVVGMVGDGINDVQALKDADCSISFASANEVARNISRIVLMDSSFSSLPDVVAEGRRAICNVERSASLYIMKNLFVMILTLLYCCMGRVYPFSASQFVIIEFFVLGMPSFCIALQPNNKKATGKFITNVLRTSICSGLSLVVAVLVVFAFVGFPSGAVVTDSTIAGGWRALISLEATAGTYALVFAGYVALFIICLPMNKFRLLVFGASLSLLVIAVPVGSYFFDNFFELILQGSDTIFIGWNNVLWISISVICALVANILLRIVDKQLEKKGAYTRIDNYFSLVKRRIIQNHKK